MGDDDFAALHHAASRRLFAYVAARVGYTDAVDVMADVFTIAWEKKSRAPHDLDSQIGWLYGIAKNKIKQELARRKRKGTETLHESDEPASADFAEAVAAADHGAQVFRALSPSDQRLFSLLFIDELDRESICKRLGISMPALYTRASRLRDRIEALSEALDSGWEANDERTA